MLPPAKQRKLIKRFYRLEKEMYTHGLLPTENLTLPSFMCIGAQKAGTTWLFANLKHHPDIALRQKEIHYFDRDAHFYAPLTDYASKFDFAPRKLKGDITPAYSILPEDRIELIKTLMPKLRLILLLRHPVERAWSSAMMFFIKKRGLNYEDISNEQLMRYLGKPEVIGRGRYPEIMERYLKFFPKEQLFIGFNEEIAQQPTDLLRRIFVHIGVNPDIEYEKLPHSRVIHEGQGTREIPEKIRERLTEIYAADIAALKKQFGDQIAHW